MKYSNEKVLEAVEGKRLFLSKLRSVRRHLETLLAKKIRIELEIKELKKVLKQREVDYNKKLKTTFTLENFNLLDQLSSESYFNFDEKVASNAVEYYSITKQLEEEFSLTHEVLERIPDDLS